MSCSLPVHPRSGLRAVGVVAGRPVWPILGGDGTAPPPPGSAAESDPPPAGQPQTSAGSDEPVRGDSDDGDLGDAGKKALAAERKARRAAEKAAADAAAKIKDFEDRDKSELQRAQDAAAAAQADAAKARAESLRLKIAAEVELPADLHEFLVGDDEDTLRAKAQKLKAATAAPGPRRPQPDPSQGPQGNPADLDQQIADALSKGDFAKSISLKRMKAQQGRAAS